MCTCTFCDCSVWVRGSKWRTPGDLCAKRGVLSTDQSVSSICAASYIRVKVHTKFSFHKTQHSSLFYKTWWSTGSTPIDAPGLDEAKLVLKAVLGLNCHR